MSSGESRQDVRFEFEPILQTREIFRQRGRIRDGVEGLPLCRMRLVELCDAQVTPDEKLLPHPSLHAVGLRSREGLIRAPHIIDRRCRSVHCPATAQDCRCVDSSTTPLFPQSDPREKTKFTLRESDACCFVVCVRQRREGEGVFASRRLVARVQCGRAMLRQPTPGRGRERWPGRNCASDRRAPPAGTRG